MYKHRQLLYDSVVVFAILVGFSFPGRIADMTIHALDPLCVYLSFLLEIIVLLMPKDGKWKNINILKLEPQYSLIYIFIISITFVSLINTHSIKEQVISMIHVGTTILFAVWVGENYNALRILELYVIAQSILVVFTLLFWAMYPNNIFQITNGEKSFCGIYTTKNSCAAELSFGILMFFVLFLLYIDKKQKISFIKVLLFIVQIVLLILSNGTGSLIVTIITALYCIFFLKTKRRILLPGACYVLGSISFLITALSILPVFKPLFDMLGKDITLTHRVPLWNKCLTVITHNNLFTGYGYGQFWLNRKAVSLINTGFRRNSYLRRAQYGSHNVLIELLLNIGLIGIMVYLTMCWRLLNKAKYLKNEEYIFVIAFIMSFMIHGFTERAFFTYDYHTLVLFIVLSLCANSVKPHIMLRNEKYILQKTE